MKKYISGFDNLDASLMLLEILEIKTENRIIREIQERAAATLKEILSKANPDWLVLLLLKAREEARKEAGK